MPIDRRTALSLAATGLAALALRGTGAKASEVFTNVWGLAIRGYDPVAYFTEGRPIEGLSEHSVAWRGATWRFATAEHRALFAAEPERYAPQYGGYCAWAVAQGYTASIDPHAWDIVEGRLFLNYSRDIQRQWQAGRDGFVTAADGNWPALARDLAQR
jgi:YHS domain-containing protein